MEIVAYADAETVALRAAEFITRQARRSIDTRGQFTLAISGGNTPWRMLALWILEDLPWERVHIYQVDERVAPFGDERRNWTRLMGVLQPQWPRLQGHVHAIPIDGFDPNAAAARYGVMLSQTAGNPAVLDLVQLGLGSDGHTASLVPGDATLSELSRDVAVTSPYQGTRRVTLTYPAINRARHILWVVAGEEKKQALAQLVARDQSVPAGRVREKCATIITDFSALGGPP